MILKVVPIRPHDLTGTYHCSHYIEGSEFAVELCSFKDEEAYVAWLKKRASCTGLTNHSLYTRMLEFADVEQVQCFAVDVKDFKDGSFDLATYTILCKTMYLLNSKGKTVDTFNTTNPQSFPKPDPSRYEKEEEGFKKGDMVTIGGRRKKNQPSIRVYPWDQTFSSQVIDKAKFIAQYIGQESRKLFKDHEPVDPFDLVLICHPLTVLPGSGLSLLRSGAILKHELVILKDTENIVPSPTYNISPDIANIEQSDFAFRAEVANLSFASVTEAEFTPKLGIGDFLGIKGAFINAYLLTTILQDLNEDLLTIEKERHGVFSFLKRHQKQLRTFYSLIKDTEHQIEDDPTPMPNKPKVRVYPWDQTFNKQAVSKAKLILQYIGNLPKGFFKERKLINPFDVVVVYHPFKHLSEYELGFVQETSLRHDWVVLKDTENVIANPTYRMYTEWGKMEGCDFIFEVRGEPLQFNLNDPDNQVELNQVVNPGEYIGIEGTLKSVDLVLTFLQLMGSNSLRLKKDQHGIFVTLGRRASKLRTLTSLIKNDASSNAITPVLQAKVHPSESQENKELIKSLEKKGISVPINNSLSTKEDHLFDEAWEDAENRHKFTAPEDYPFVCVDKIKATEGISEKVVGIYQDAVDNHVPNKTKFTRRVLNDSHVATVTDTNRGRERVRYSVWQNTVDIPREDIDNSFLILQNISIQTVDLKFGMVSQPVPGLGIVCIRDVKMGWRKNLEKAVKAYKWSIIKDDNGWFNKHIVKSIRNGPSKEGDTFAFENMGKISVQLAVNKKPLKVASGSYAVWRGPLYAQDLREMHKALANLGFRLCSNSTGKLLESLFQTIHTKSLKTLEDLQEGNGYGSNRVHVLLSNKKRLLAFVYEHDDCSNFTELQEAYLTLQNATMSSVPLGNGVSVPGLGVVCFMVPFEELDRHLRYVLQDDVAGFKWLIHKDKDGVFADPHANALVANIDYATHDKDTTFILQNKTGENAELPLLFVNADKLIVPAKGYFVWDGPLSNTNAFRVLQGLVNSKKFELVYDNTGTVIETLFNLGGTWFPKTPPMCSR